MYSYVEHSAMMQLDIYGAATHLSVSDEFNSSEGLWESLRDTEMIRRLAGTQINERMISTITGNAILRYTATHWW